MPISNYLNLFVFIKRANSSKNLLTALNRKSSSQLMLLQMTTFLKNIPAAARYFDIIHFFAFRRKMPNLEPQTLP